MTPKALAVLASLLYELQFYTRNVKRDPYLRDLIETGQKILDEERLRRKS